MVAITPNNHTAIFVKEIRALCPNNKIDPNKLSEIDQKVQNLMHDQRFQFPQIAGRLQDLSVSIQRILKPQPNQEITKLDYEGIYNKIDIIAKLAQDVSISTLQPEDISAVYPFTLPNITKWTNENSRKACAHFDIVDPNSTIEYSFLASILAEAYAKLSEDDAMAIFDLLLRAGNSPNDVIRPANFSIAVFSLFIRCFETSTSTKRMQDLPRHLRRDITKETIAKEFKKLIQMLDLYLQYGADANLQPSKKISEFLPTSYVMAQEVSRSPYLIQILQHLVEKANLDVNMTYISVKGREFTMLEAAVQRNDPIIEFLETLIYYGARYFRNSTAAAVVPSATASTSAASASASAASSAASMPPRLDLPEGYGEPPRYSMERAFALYRAVSSEYALYDNVPEIVFDTTRLGIGGLVSHITDYYYEYPKIVQIARDCIARKKEFNQKYDDCGPTKAITAVVASSNNTAASNSTAASTAAASKIVAKSKKTNAKK